MELEDSGPGPHMTEPRPVSDPAVEDGYQGQEVTAAAQDDNYDDVEKQECSDADVF